MRAYSVLTFSLLVAAALGAGCKERVPPPATTGSAGSAIATGSANAAAGSDSPEAKAKAIVASRDITGIVGHMNDEAAHRPKAGVTAEQLFEALEKNGIDLGSRQQVVGATMLAAYCANGRTTDGVVVAICEYASDDAATKGMAFMNKRFPLDPTTSREMHHAAVMTVVRQPAHDDIAKKAITTFLAL